MRRFWNALTGPQDRLYLNIAMPAAIEGLFMGLLASADLIMVGSLGTLSIAAVSIFLQPRMVLLCFARSLASSVTLLTARKTGSGDMRGVSEILRKSLTLGFVFMGSLHLLFFFLLRYILILMGAGNDYLPEAVSYGQIAAFSVFITSMTSILQAVQLGQGKTAVIMKSNICGNLVNILVNALLIFGLGPFPKLGVMGAAIGTVIGTLCTFTITVYIMDTEKYFSQGGSWLPDRTYFKETLPLFGSIISEQGSERAGIVLFTRMAASLGTVPFAVHSICMNICDFYFDFATGLGKASMVLAGQSNGAKDEEGWRRQKRTGLKWSLLFSTVVFLLILLFREQLFSIYSKEPEALAASGIAMFLVALVSFPEAHTLVCSGILRGSGKTAAVALYSFISITILRPLITAFFLFYMEWGLAGAWLAILLDQTIRAACASFLLKRIELSHELSGDNR